MSEKKKDIPPEIDAFTRVCDMAKVHFVDYIVIARIKTKDSIHFSYATSDQCWASGAMDRTRDMMMQSDVQEERKDETSD